MNIVNSIKSRFLPSPVSLDIIKLILLSARQGDEHGLPDESHLSHFLSDFAGESNKPMLLNEYSNRLGEINLHNFKLPCEIPVRDSVKALAIARNLTKILDDDQKLTIIVFLMELSRIHKNYSHNRMELAETISVLLGYDKTRFSELRQFMFEVEPFDYVNNDCLYASGAIADIMFSLKDVKHTRIKPMKGVVLFQRFHNDLVFFRSFGDDHIIINDHAIQKYKTYSWKSTDMLLINETAVNHESIHLEIKKIDAVTPVFIAETQFTPEVNFLSAEGQLWITGTSVPEDAREFYHPLLLWINKYLSSEPPQIVTIHFRLDFFNTLSSKLVLEFLKRAEKMKSEKLQVFVKWYYEEGDEDIMEAGENYAFIVRLPFEMIAYNNRENLASTKSS